MPSLFTKPLTSLTRICCRNPISVLALALCLACLGVYWASEHLGFKMSRIDLINPNSGFNRLWLDYIEEFGDHDEVILVVEGSGNVEVIPVLESLSEQASRFPHLFRGVLHGVDLARLRLKGLHYVPASELAVISQFATDSQQFTSGKWERLRVDSMIDSITYRLQHAREPVQFVQTLRELDSFSLSLSGVFGTNPSYESPWPNMQPTPQAAVPDVVAACSQTDTNYFIFPTKTGVMGFVMLKLTRVDKTQLAQGKESIDTLRTIVSEMRRRHPALKIGLTGMPILEYDEMQTSSSSMTKATVIAFVGVTAIFMAGSGGIRHPFLAMLVLMVGFAWTLGYITLAVGHLNILSISFGAMLIGLGTDFSVHYIARYLELRRQQFSCEDALCQTAGIVGPGILTGALTTAIAFYMASFTEFTGISELGTIAGGGIILCALSTFIVLPTLIRLCDRNCHHKLNRKYFSQIPTPLDIRGFLGPTRRFPATTLVLSAVVIIILFCGIPKVWYDHNLLNLQPEGLESVQLEERLLDMDVAKGGKNVWFALSIADTKEELLSRKRAFADKYPQLTVEEIVSWFPEGDPKKIAILEQMARSLEKLPERPTEIIPASPEEVGNAIGRLQYVLLDPQNPLAKIAKHVAPFANSTPDTTNSAELTNLADMPTNSTITSVPTSNGTTTPDSNWLVSLDTMIPNMLRRLAETRESIRRMSEANYQSRMIYYQSAVAGDLLTRLQTLRSMSIPEPPKIEDLPESLVSRFVGKGGKHLMRIYTTANIWNMDEMSSFVKAVRDIDPKATGSPLQTYEASRQMQQGFLSAAFYAFGAVIFFMFLDFRNVKDTLIALIPMLIGFGMMFGFLGWLNIPLNPANMIVLPLIFGIGIDDGVHLIHDYRARRGRYQIKSSTATAVLITSLTTIIGFGSMMTASHRGLQSLGRVLVIGVCCCLFASLVLLPVILSLITRKEKNTSESDDEQKQRFEFGNELEQSKVDSGEKSNDNVEKMICFPKIAIQDTIPFPSSPEIHSLQDYRCKYTEFPTFESTNKQIFLDSQDSFSAKTCDENSRIIPIMSHKRLVRRKVA
ncbi:MAG: MMPL family transporter [Thermoguttaceae bacterium]